MAYNPKKHLITVQGGKEYLPVAYRLVWFREEHPEYGIDTKPLLLDVEKGVAVFSATITDSEGRLLAAGVKMETARGFADFVEKASTGAIGRALGVLGYGTQWALDELDEGIERLVDSPLPIGNGNGGEGRGRRDGHNATGNGKPVANIDRNIATCAECGKVLTSGQRDLSTARYGKPLCPSHQTQQPRAAGAA